VQIVLDICANYILYVHKVCAESLATVIL